MKGLKLFLFISCLFAGEASGGPIERTAIDLPPMVRDQFLYNMRDHLMALSEIQTALAKGDFENAADIAAHRLGLNASSSAACSMDGHKARPGDNSALSKYMPEKMHRIGFEMHSAADQFAAEAREAAATRDYGKAIASLSLVTKQCVACHSSFKLSGR